ncbi:MAG: hypothetical protein JWP87_1224 [Labilithrix sp.]|jgi:hypothetical protein|nr:hypothetical protein [Labilithrix sp.]
MRSLATLALLGVAAVACAADPTPYTFTDGGASTPAVKGTARKVDFEELSLGKGTPAPFAHVLGDWTIEQENGHRVLAQIGELEDPDFPRLLLRDTAFTNVHVKVRCSMRGGSTDRACGIIWRAKDSDNYYVARANALEDNVNVYRVVANDRQQLGGAGMSVTSNDWHTLEAFMEGAHIRVVWDGHEVVSVDEGTFPAGGKVGVWTKADSVTAFDDLEATEL